jgi:hypothetical protein
MSICRSPGCGRPRASRNHYCRTHAKRLFNYGDPEGRPIPRPWLLHFAVQARHVLERNANHAGLRLASEELRRLLDRSRALVAAGDRSDPSAAHFARLAAHGVSPVHILSMVVAVGLFDQDQPNFLRNTLAYKLAVARAVVGLVPRIVELRLNKTTAERIGDMLVERYAALVGGVIAAIKKAEVDARQRNAALSTPLTP